MLNLDEWSINCSCFLNIFLRYYRKCIDSGRNAEILPMIATHIELKYVTDRQEMWLVSRRKISD